MKYPVIQIYETIQGQGYRTGEPIILIRTGVNPAIELAYLKPIRPAPITMMTAPEIGRKCEEFDSNWVFFGGEDPAFLNPSELFDELHKRSYYIWVDTCGMIDLPHVDHVSLGPKPGLPVDYRMLRKANDIRFYWDLDPIWEENVDRCLLKAEQIPVIQIIPRRLDKDCIEGALRYTLKLAKKYTTVYFDVPLYRLLPDFDSCLCEGESCPICNFMDKKEVKDEAS